MTEKNYEEVNVDLNNAKGVVGKSFDDYNFQESKIEIVKTIKNTFTDKKTGKNVESLSVMVQSGILNDKELRATEFFSIWINKETKEIEFSKTPSSNTAKMMSYFKVEKFPELIGKECKVVVRVKDNGEKKLGIYFGN